MPAAGRRLLVDVSGVARFDARSGVQRVVRGVLGELLRSPREGCEVIPVRAGRWIGYRYAGSYAEQLGPASTGAPSGKVRARRGDAFFGLDLATNILPRHEAQLAGWKRDGASLHFFVHDLLPLQHPEWFTDAGARNYGRWMRCLQAHADGAICSTNAVAEELRGVLRASPDEHARRIAVSWVHLGADLGATAPTEGLPAGFEDLVARLRSRPTVLMVGTIEPRKGHAQALSAFELLWSEGRAVNLAIVGNVGWRVEELVQRLRRHAENARRLFWLEGASDEALGRMYALADGVLLASEAEGFGLPLIEAARHGTPLLARDIPVYREIAGEHARFFAGRDARSLADALGGWVDSIRGGTAASSAGIKASTWAQAAQRIYDILLRQPPRA
jgi:glycosyltransferase involved in cell wall biosynthesis